MSGDAVFVVARRSMATWSGGGEPTESAMSPTAARDKRAVGRSVG
jgi:hypothetical protein